MQLEAEIEERLRHLAAGDLLEAGAADTCAAAQQVQVPGKELILAACISWHCWRNHWLGRFFLGSSGAFESAQL